MQSASQLSVWTAPTASAKLPRAAVLELAQTEGTGDAVVPPVKRQAPQMPAATPDDSKSAGPKSAEPKSGEPKSADPKPAAAPAAQKPRTQEAQREPAAAPPQSSAGSIFAPLTDWLARANREYQGNIVKELSKPAPEVLEAETQRLEQEKAAQAKAAQEKAAQQARAAEDERKAAEAARQAAAEDARKTAEAEAARKVQAAAKDAEAKDKTQAETTKPAGTGSEADATKQTQAARDAEQAKKAQEEQKAQAARAAEEARRSQEARKADDAKKAEDAKRADDARKADEVKKAEEAQKAGEAKKLAADAEARRLREAARVADEKRQEQQRQEQARKQQAQAERKAAEDRLAEERRAKSAAKEAADAESVRPAAQPRVSEAPAGGERHRRWAITITPEPIRRPIAEPTGGRPELIPPRVREEGAVLLGSRRLTPRMGLGAGGIAGTAVKRWVWRAGACRYAGHKVKRKQRYTVAKGDSLWRISEKHYDAGTKYPRIYRANRDRISDPDLIYPCQRFKVPKR